MSTEACPAQCLLCGGSCTVSRGAGHAGMHRCKNLHLWP
jgi:hypothetical protein